MSRTPNPMTGNQFRWRDDLAQIVQQAVAPLADDVKEMRQAIQELKLNQVNRSDVYDRAVMDEKLKQMVADISSVNDQIKAVKEFWWKALGGTVAIMTILAYFVQHISIH